MIPQYIDILNAHSRVQPFIHKTPVLSSTSINEMFGCHIFFKCENFQKAGAFKYRGATNAILNLNDEERKKGVATHSSGNHAGALALAAKMRNIKSFIVMPDNSPEIKKKAVAGYGAEITFCKPTLQAREETLNNIVEKTGATFIHPYNNFNIICGQGTAALELLEKKPELDTILCPVGGGGLLSGTVIATKGENKNIKVIGCEPLQANDAFLSFKSKAFVPSNNPLTIADGLKTSLGSLTYEIILSNVDDILTAKEETIIQAMRIVWERMKIIIEPSSAVPLAVLMENEEKFKGKNVGVIISGGNVELSKLPF